MEMTTESAWNDIQEKHEMAYFKGQRATEFPESYTVEEMKEISDGTLYGHGRSRRDAEGRLREHAPVRPGQDA